MFIFNQDNKLVIKNDEHYKHCSKGDIECLYTGYLVYRKSDSLRQSIDRLMTDFRANNINFDEFLGSFRVILINHETDRVLLFCDNSGSACFFINEKTNIVSDSLVELADLSDTIKPNYLAIVQFLQTSKILDTLCADIQRTDPACYYLVNSRGVMKKNKGLTSLSKLNNYSSLHEILAVMLRSAKSENKIAAIITGGTDSRAVLANLMNFDLPIGLAISGNEQHEDVKAAKEIAKVIGKELLISDEEPWASLGKTDTGLSA